MEKQISSFLIGLLITAFSITGVDAKSDVWVINKDHSELLLSIPYMGVSDVTARLRSFSGKIYFNKERPSEIQKIKVKIKATSFDSNHKIRDGHVKSEDFLDTKKFPFIVFDSDQVKKLNKGYQAKAILEIKGTSRPILLNFTLSKPVKDSWGHINRFVNFAIVINRKDFGVTWSKGIGEGEFLVGEEIALKGNVQIQPIGDKTPTYKHMLPNTYYIKMSEKLQRGEITLEEFKKAIKTKGTTYSSKLDPIENSKDHEEVVEREEETQASQFESDFWKGLEYNPPAVRDGKWWVSFSFVSLIGATATAFAFGLFYEVKKDKIKEKEGGVDLFLTLIFVGAFSVLVIFFTSLSYMAS